jgi:DNA-binding LacI/PurR family transcriptional regulator
MEYKRRITQRELAAAAGVDVSTVSLALNHHPRIPLTTRRRILKLAVELGYRPDPALASLAAHRWQGRRDYGGVTLALAIDTRDRKELEWRLYAQGIRDRAAAIGYGINEFQLTDYPSPRRFWAVVRQRGIRGVIFVQSRASFAKEWMTEAVTPCVHCGFLHPVEADVVMPNLEAAVRLAWKEVVTPDTRVALFLPAEPELYSDQIFLGTALALLRTKTRRADVRLFDDRPGSVEKLAAWKPHRVITINEKQARALLRAGLPVACPVYPLHLLSHGRQARGVRLQMGKVGAAAVDFLELKIRRYPLGVHHSRQTLMIDPVWVKG